MTSPSVFSNHAGTMSESFAIGKRGVQLLQGTAEPTGISAPLGSLYLLKGSPNRVYQIDGLGNWSPLLTPASISQGNGVTVTYNNGLVTVSANTTKFKQVVESANLVANTYLVNHNLDEQYPIVQVYDSTNQVIFPDSIMSVDAFNTLIDFTSYVSSETVWTVTVISGV